MSITTAQIRGARGILHWSQNDLSERTGISTTSIGALEKGATQARESTLSKIQKVFEDNGIEFTPNDGLRKRSVEVEVFRGKDGFANFFELLFSTIEKWSGEICISNVEEEQFIHWAGESAKKHMERVSSLTNVNYKVLLKDGDKNFLANSYAQYKWLPKEFFSSVPFYVFEKKLAIFVFEEEPVIILHKFPAIAEAYKSQFNALWNIAHQPDREAA